MFLEENLLDPDTYVDVHDCNRNTEGRTEAKNRARKSRALEEVEEEEEAEEAGEKGKMWGSQS